MNIDDIEKFLSKNSTEEIAYARISFKKRDDVFGVFIRDRDYEDLKSKNFWRIVTKIHLDEFEKTGNLSLARIFSGSAFSRLTTYKESF